METCSVATKAATADRAEAHSPSKGLPVPADGILPEDKKYYCQRCLNHELMFPRKGHKPHCRFATCSCNDCSMVETRRQLNNMIQRRRVINMPVHIQNGRKVRDPKCARCAQHGVIVQLRGHKKTLCQFNNCKCDNCHLVNSRRGLMARQIKLRRDQAKARQVGGPSGGRASVDSEQNSTISDSSLSTAANVSRASSPRTTELIAPQPIRPLVVSQPSPTLAAIVSKPETMLTNSIVSNIPATSSSSFSLPCSFTAIPATSLPNFPLSYPSFASSFAFSSPPTILQPDDLTLQLYLQYLSYRALQTSAALPCPINTTYIPPQPLMLLPDLVYAAEPKLV